MKKDLISHSGKIDQTKRILIVGNSNTPWTGSIDDYKKIFMCTVPGNEVPLMCYIPYPDYLSRTRLWTHFIHLHVNIIHICFLFYCLSNSQ